MHKFLLATVVIFTTSYGGLSYVPISSGTSVAWSYQDELESDSIEEMFDLLDDLESEDLDSLNYLIDKLLAVADTQENHDLRTRLELVRISSLISFNRQKEADSLLKSLEMVSISDPKLLLQHQIYTGRILKWEGKLAEALEAFYNAIESANQSQSDEMLGDIYADIASVLRENGDLESCTKYYQYALKEGRKYDNVKLQVRACQMLCRAYNGGIIINLDSSVYYGELGISIAKEAGYERGYAEMVNMVSAPIIRHGQFKRGIELSLEALEYADQYNFTTKSRYYLILNIGFAYEKLGLYDSAIIRMKQGAELRPEGIDHYRLKYLINESTGNFEEALAALKHYAFKKDSIVRKIHRNKLSNMQARLETNVKEQQVASLSQQSRIQALELQQKNQFILIGIIVVVVAGGAIGFVVYQRTMRNRQARLEVEHRFLRSQLNPHFIFNALLAIQNFMLENSAREAAIYLSKFSKLMRKILESSRKEFISIDQEIEMLKNYLDIHQLKMENSFDYKIAVDESIETESDCIPPMFVQPFVENAIEHGILNISERGEILVKLKKEGSHIGIEIQDNGGGLNAKSKATDHISLSSAIIQERMDLFNETLKNKISLSIDEVKDEAGNVMGTKVALKVPFSYI